MATLERQRDELQHAHALALASMQRQLADRDAKIEGLQLRHAAEARCTDARLHDARFEARREKRRASASSRASFGSVNDAASLPPATPMRAESAPAVIEVLSRVVCVRCAVLFCDGVVRSAHIGERT